MVSSVIQLCYSSKKNHSVEKSGVNIFKKTFSFEFHSAEEKKFLKTFQQNCLFEPEKMKRRKKLKQKILIFAEEARLHFQASGSLGCFGFGAFRSVLTTTTTTTTAAITKPT